MPPQPTIPPLLSSHLSSPTSAGSLKLVTSVLGASANWIILRHVQAALKPQLPIPSDNEGNTAIVFVSWLRGLDFWKDGTRRLVGYPTLTGIFNGFPLQSMYIWF